MISQYPFGHTLIKLSPNHASLFVNMTSDLSLYLGEAKIVYHYNYNVLILTKIVSILSKQNSNFVFILTARQV
ncbi:hypothetical protein BDC45DRAFT_504124 [Circinella umbellata]|nr:hypothetical protein BDC45DRAFT_504124 [Circinella umbellata]